MSTAAFSQPLPSSRGAGLRLVDPVEVPDDEQTLQGHALALESHSLRRRAERHLEDLECGRTVERGELRSILRAFRAYRPFVFPRDRKLNDAASRALSHAATLARGVNASVA